MKTGCRSSREIPFTQNSGHPHSSPFYFPIKNNDIEGYALNFFADQKFAKVDPLPQNAVWYFFTDATSDKQVAFFDSNSIDKNGDRVTLWEMFVNDEAHPSADGTLSAAMKVTYSCKKMTMQTTVYTTYDMERRFYVAFKSQEQAKPVAEGTVAGAVLKKVCEDGFPHDHSDFSYFSIGDKDVYEFSKSFFEGLKAKTKEQ